MHYYIYPAGKSGKTFGKMLDFINANVSYSFIDDGKPGITLQEQAAEIKNRIASKEAEVVIVLTQGIQVTQEREKQLIHRLTNAGIHIWRGAEFVEKIALQVCREAKNRISTFNRGGVLIGIVLYGFAGEKHLGNVDYELLRKGCKVVYLDNSGEEFVRIESNDNVMVIPYLMDYFKYIDFIKYFFSTASTYTRNENQIFFVQHHSYSSVLEAIMEDKIDYLKEIYRNNIDYLFVTCERIAKAAEVLIQDLPQKNQPFLVKSGYAAFDNEKEIQEYSRDLVLFALHDEEEVLEIYEAMKMLLEKGYKVGLRYRYEWVGKSKEIIELLGSFPNFSVNYNNRDFETTLAKTFVLITSASGVAYTFPIKHLCPVILYFKDKSLFEKTLGGVGFFDERIHLMANSSMEILLKVQEVQKINYREKILSYRNTEVIYFKEASRVIADKIWEIIQKG